MFSAPKEQSGAVAVDRKLHEFPVAAELHRSLPYPLDAEQPGAREKLAGVPPVANDVVVKKEILLPAGLLSGHRRQSFEETPADETPLPHGDALSQIPVQVMLTML